MTTPNCPYCNNPSVLFSESSRFYGGRDFGPQYACEPCQAWVGCHPGTTKPLGRLANKELRGWKGRAHAAFDPLWQSKRMTRHEAYAHMQKLMKMTPDQAHIGLFDVAECQRLIGALTAPAPVEFRSESSGWKTGKHYKPSGCDCSLPPWMLCRPDCEHALRAPA
jgi:zinc-finger-containing domain